MFYIWVKNFIQYGSNAEKYSVKRSWRNKGFEAKSIEDLDLKYFSAEMVI